MDLEAKGGGYKISKGSSSRKYFAGVTGSRTVSVTFDLKAPTHCKLENTCKSSYLPVDVGRKIDNNVSSFSSNFCNDHICSTWLRYSG